ncbi:BofC C-terminal domain-containing protein [Mobilitalea sibirica]|uniref:BofC C-terminal domain-containing protein n=1 Tax=Mobilitalea sibirica TaxID=1462919 RepID=A0A8J7H3H1_9FIRM|nr:BofC C-terminal domain-containing protein [Mobilitalea sibirica]MBH1941460.1 BofC C-terminal domain-containing protein [Mobilitalea sibirica]
MRLRKAYIYLLSFISLSVMFSTCYYLSYKHALNEFNRRAIERNLEFVGLQDNTMPTPSVKEENNETVSVNVQPDTILPSTKYTLMIYDIKSGTNEKYEQNPPGYLVGLNREEVLEYLSEYMSDLTLSEYNKGLLSYELIEFSSEAVVLRKSYDPDMVPFRFYVAVKDGYVVVYNSDLKSVFSYTHIEAKNLPEEDRIELSKGIYLNSIDEVYSLLESYSS